MNAIDTLGRQKYVLLETRKRDGSWVGTPVSIVVDGGRAFFRAWDGAGKAKRRGTGRALCAPWEVSGKAKRLRTFPEVRVAPSTMRGKPTGPRLAGTARLLDD